MRDRDTRERALTLEDAAAAIRHSAGVRGVAAGEELSRAEHDAVMGPPRDRASGRRDAADADWLYPTAQMIDSSVGWENALTAAGLRRARGGGVTRGLPLVDVLERFLHAHGYLAGYNTAAAWARRQGLAIRQGKNTTQAFAALRERRRAQGRWTPPGILPARLRPALPEERKTEDPERTPGSGARPPRKWSDAEIKAGLRIAVRRAHEQGVRLGQRQLRDFAKEDPDIPGWTVLETRTRRRQHRRPVDPRGHRESGRQPDPLGRGPVWLYFPSRQGLEPKARGTGQCEPRTQRPIVRRVLASWCVVPKNAAFFRARMPKNV